MGRSSVARHCGVTEDYPVLPVTPRYNPTETSVALTPGTRLGMYEIVSLIGAGGMGEVFLAGSAEA